MQIAIGNETAEVRIGTAGLNFGTIAKVRIGGKEFQSPVVPLGMTTVATERLLELVQREYPSAHAA